MTDAHIAKVWTGIVTLTLISLVFPPTFVLVTMLFGYLGLLFVVGLVRISAESFQRPRRQRRPVRLSVKDAADVARATAKNVAVAASLDTDWRPAWKALCDSPAEIAFLNAAIDGFGLRPQDRLLAGGGITLDLQTSISFMRVDFLVNSRTVVEIDGAAFHSSASQKQNDAKRDVELAGLGYHIVRIPAKRVFERPGDVIRDLRAYLTATQA